MRIVYTVPLLQKTMKRSAITLREMRLPLNLLLRDSQYEYRINHIKTGGSE